MKAFLAAVVVAVGVAFGASIVLEDQFQQSASTVFATEGVRLSN
ncbi:MAG: hypothetical protein ACXIUV_00685 [Alkalilacustris sp.]